MCTACAVSSIRQSDRQVFVPLMKQYKFRTLKSERRKYWDDLRFDSWTSLWGCYFKLCWPIPGSSSSPGAGEQMHLETQPFPCQTGFSVLPWKWITGTLLPWKTLNHWVKWPGDIVKWSMVTKENIRGGKLRVACFCRQNTWDSQGHKAVSHF